MITKQELLSKLKAAEKGSPELSAEVFKYFNPDTKWKRSEFLDRDVYIIDKYGCLDFPPSLTTSIDAAVKAVEEHLPDWSLEVTQTISKKHWYCTLVYSEDLWLQTEIHKSLPIAIMIALIEATEEDKT